MALLTKYTTPAERARGCVWADRFESQAQVERNGGSVTGAPTFSARDGVTLDGSNDYLTYLLQHNVLGGDSLTFVVEFSPDNAYDYGTSEYYFSADSDGGGGANNIRFMHSTGFYQVWLNTTTIGGVAEAAVQSLWRQYNRNIFVISTTSGDTDMWLNGTQVLTNDITAWTPIGNLPMSLYVGARFSASNKFSGTIHRLQIYNQKLSDLECEQISSGTVYSYPQGTVWDFTAAHGLSDASGANTLTAYNAPTKLAVHGYEFDGVNQYLQGTIDTSIFNQTAISYVAEFTPRFANDGVRYIIADWDDGAGGSRGNIDKYTNDRLYIYFSLVTVESIPWATYGPYWRVDQRNVLVVSLVSGNTYAWLNGYEILTADNTAFSTNSDISRLTVGKVYSGASGYFDGQIHSFHVIPAQLSRMQAIDITQRLLKQANRV